MSQQKNKAEGDKSARILASEAQMQEQVNKSMGLAKAAEAEKIQKILQSEAEMQSKVNKSIALAKAAESEKLSQVVLAEADRDSQIIRSEGLAKAIAIEHEARATSLERMGQAIQNVGGSNAAAFLTADNFVKAFSMLAKESNTLIVPSNPADIGAVVTQALSIYQKVSSQQKTLSN